MKPKKKNKRRPQDATMRGEEVKAYAIANKEGFLIRSVSDSPGESAAVGLPKIDQRAHPLLGFYSFEQAQEVCRKTGYEIREIEITWKDEIETKN